MTPREIINIHNALNELSKTVFPYKLARKIAGLSKRVKAEIEVINSQERAITNKYNGKYEPGGKISFPDTDTAVEFTREFDAMMDEDVDIRLTPVDVSKYADTLQLTPQTIEALEGVIIFEEGDNGRQTDKQSTGGNEC